MEMKRLEIGFDSKVIRDVYSHKSVKRTKNGKQIYVSVPKLTSDPWHSTDEPSGSKRMGPLSNF